MRLEIWSTDKHGWPSEYMLEVDAASQREALEIARVVCPDELGDYHLECGCRYLGEVVEQQTEKLCRPLTMLAIRQEPCEEILADADAVTPTIYFAAYSKGWNK